MGQGRSRDSVYVAPESSQQQPLRKTGSLTSLTLGKMGRRSSSASVKRSRSFRENKELLEAQLREKIEREGKALDKWVSERSKRQKERPVAALVDLAAVVVAGCLESALDCDALAVPRELKEAVMFRLSPSFDDSMADSKVRFSNSGRTVQYTGKGYSTCVMKTPFNRGFRNGRHAWIVHVDASRVQGWTQIGVLTQERQQAGCVTKWDGNPHPFRKGEIARRNNGNFHSGRNELEATMVAETIFLGGYGLADTISVQLDFDSSTLQWLKNGEAYGGKVRIEEDVLFPSVSLDSPGEGVTLAYYTGPLTL